MGNNKCKKYISQLEKADRILANVAKYVKERDPKCVEELETASKLSGELIQYIKTSNISRDNLFDVDPMFDSIVEKSDIMRQDNSSNDSHWKFGEEEPLLDAGENFSNLETAISKPMGAFGSLDDEIDFRDSYRERENFYEEYTSLPDYVEVLKRNVSYVDFLKAHPKLMLRNKANIILSYMVGKWGCNSEGLVKREPRICITDINESGFMTESNNKFLVKLEQFNELFKEVKPHAVQVSDDNELATKLARVFYTLADRPGITKEYIEVIIKKFIFAVERKGFVLNLNSAYKGKQLILDIIEKIPDAPVYIGWSGYEYSKSIDVKMLFKEIMTESASMRDIELFSEFRTIQWENRKITVPARRVMKCLDLLQFGRPEDNNMLKIFLTKVTKDIIRNLDKLASAGVEVPAELYDIDVDNVWNLEVFVGAIVSSSRLMTRGSSYHKRYAPGLYYRNIKRGNY